MEKEHRKSAGLLELIGAIVTGLFIGYMRQRLADSGEVYWGEVYWDRVEDSVLIAVGAYAIAFIAARKMRSGFGHRIPSWLLVAGFGSVLCGISLNGIYYMIRNWDHIQRYGSETSSVIDITISLFVAIPLYFLFALPILGGLQLLNYLFRKVQQARNQECSETSSTTR